MKRHTDPVSPARDRAGTARSRSRGLVPALAAAIVVAMASPAGPAYAHDPVLGVQPPSVLASLAPGASLDVAKTVHTPEILPTPDIYFLADSTGSMDEAIANVQANAAAVLSAVDGLANDPRYGAGDYKDFQSPTQFDPYAFRNGAPIPAVDDDGAAALAAIGAWSADGGVDGPEGQFHALHRLAAHGDASFRVTGTPIVVWFGDAPAHDPVCDEISGDTGHDVTEATLTAELVGAGIRVIAISVVTDLGDFFPSALDDDPTAFGGDYLTACGTEGGTSGQATRIANATGGVHLTGIDPGDIADAILDGLGALDVTVDPVPTCDAGLSVSFAPASRTLTSGEDALFTETITAAPDAPQGTTLTCTVDFLVDGQLLDGFTQEVTIEILDVTAPEASCDPTTNPAGKKVPPAGGKPGKQNPDGFYVLTASDNVDPTVDIFLVDDVSGTVFGPFETGTKIKLVQAPGAKPALKPGAGAIDWKVRFKGDAILSVTDAAGNTTEVSCRVPPKPA
jgi:hypothetical protein